MCIMRANVSLKETVALRKYWFSLLHFLFSKRKWKVFFGPLFFQKKVESFNMRPKAASHS